MKSKLAILLIIIIVATLAAPAHAVRVKDIASIDGVRDNQLIGFGLVGGLAGTGDDPKNALYTAAAISGMLSQFGFQIPPESINVKNFAAVAVTTNMPAYIKNGDRLDVAVSSIGSAKSLEGGMLYQTLLFGQDGNVYAVAQGPVSLGDFVGGAGGARGGKKFTTVGRIVGGAIVENEIPSTVLSEAGTIRLNLHRADFATAQNVCDAIQRAFGLSIAIARDAGTIEILVPTAYQTDLVPFIAAIESLDVDRDETAKVVINQRTGTVIMGGDIEVLPVAIAHGNLSITIGGDGRIVSSSPDAGTVTTQAQTGASATGSASGAGGGSTDSDTRTEKILRVSANDIVTSLNAIGVEPRDLVAIFEAIAAAGALQGELEVI